MIQVGLGPELEEEDSPSENEDGPGEDEDGPGEDEDSPGEDEDSPEEDENPSLLHPGMLHLLVYCWTLFTIF